MKFGQALSVLEAGCPTRSPSPTASSSTRLRLRSPDADADRARRPRPRPRAGLEGPAGLARRRPDRRGLDRPGAQGAGTTAARSPSRCSTPARTRCVRSAPAGAARPDRRPARARRRDQAADRGARSPGRRRSSTTTWRPRRSARSPRRSATTPTSWCRTSWPSGADRAGHRVAREPRRRWPPCIAEGTQEERDHYASSSSLPVLGPGAAPGMLHADPHPGNFRVHARPPDGAPGRMGVLDFGAVARLRRGGLPEAMGR